jgi:hypothetical protein
MKILGNSIFIGQNSAKQCHSKKDFFPEIRIHNRQLSINGKPISLFNIGGNISK